ncbi:alpha/beta fold hydrolase [Aeromicrobium sp.]
MASVPATEQGSRSGTFANGMDYLTWGGGPKTLLFIQGGPGSAVPKGMMLRMSRRFFDPFLHAGFAVWVVTRRRHMPPGHTVADMADDFAQVITDDFGGRVDLLVGESYGGMITQHLAARHPGSIGHITIIVAGAEVSDWGKEVDTRLAGALARGDISGAGTVFTEYMLPGASTRWVRRLIGPFVGRHLLAGSDYPLGDVLTEVQAEMDFDSRPALPRIQGPVLLICGDRDLFFPKDVIEETAELIPNSTLVWYEGKGHVKTASSKRIAHDVLAFVNRN